MNNLERFLSEIAWGLDEQAGALTDDGAAAIAPTAGALRDYASQMRAVATATAPDGSVAWSTIDDEEIGVELEPEPRPPIRIVIVAAEVEHMARESGIPPATAMARVADWGRSIEGTAKKWCRSRLSAAIRGERP
ncbi:MAG TPA: hypothetical protein VHA80_06630 [Solirubrobacterales bacterium]|nr:hypothetical protein [Solirubrobacterales bacterium]